MSNTSAPRFMPGTKFVRTNRKHPKTETVEDVITWTNLSGEVVGRRYVCSHIFCGQIVMDRDVLETTIARGLVEA